MIKKANHISKQKNNFLTNYSYALDLVHEQNLGHFSNHKNEYLFFSHVMTMIQKLSFLYQNYKFIK